MEDINLRSVAKTFLDLWRAGDLRGALATVQKALADLRARRRYSDAIMVFNWTKRLLDVMGQNPRADALRRELLRELMSQGKMKDYVVLLLCQQYDLWDKGDLKAASRNLREIRKVSKNPSQIAEAEAIVHFLRGDMRAVEECTKGFDIPLLIPMQAKAMAYQGKFDEVLDLLDRAPGDRGVIDLTNDALRAFVLASLGKTLASSRMFASVIERARNMHPLVAIEDALIDYGVLWYSEGDPERGKIYLDLAESSALYNKSTLSLFKIRALQNSLNPGGFNAIRNLEALLEETAELGLVIPQLYCLWGLSHLMSEEGLSQKAQEYAQKTLDMAHEKGLLGLLAYLCRGLPQSSVITVRGLSVGKGPAVRLLLLGTWEMEVAGRRAKLQGKRPAELLAYLAMNQDRSLTKDEVVSQFWPNMSPRDGLRNYYRFLSLAKAQLASCGITLPNTRPRGLARLDVNITVDAEEFSALVSTARALGRTGQARDAANFYESAIGLYRGNFLPGSKMRWAEELRDLYRRMFTEACLFVGERRLEEAPEEALAHANRALAAEPLSEEACELALRALMRLGRKPEAKRLYDRFVRDYRTTLEAEPDIEWPRKQNPRPG